MSSTDADWLDRVAIASPCDEPWDGMRGDDKTRHCAACRLNVHNIVAMTRDEAESFLGGAEGRICVRIHRRPDGTILTQDCAPERGRVTRRLRRMRVALTGALALLGLAGCRRTPEPQVTTGVVALPADWEADAPGAPAPDTPDVESKDQK